MYDIIIIGAGAAGLSAGIYAGRGAMKTLVIEAVSAGGQMNSTYEIDNYPGMSDNPDGVTLSQRMKEHAEKFDIEFSTETVKEILGANDRIKTVKTRKNIYHTKAIIFATGAKPKKGDIPGEEKFHGMGVSYCATCDGAFFKGQDTVVIGGGNTAFEDALYLSNFAKSVTIIHRRDTFRAAKTLVDKAMNNKKINIVTDSVVTEIKGDTTVSSVKILNKKTNKTSELLTSGVFVAIGVIPTSELAGKYVELDDRGFIITNDNLETNISGIYAAGDVRNTPLRQIVTAAADGAIAATSATNYING